MCEKTRVIVFVCGGLVQGAIADGEVDLLIVDYDADERDTTLRDPFEPDIPINMYGEIAVEEVSKVSAYFDLNEKKDTVDEDFTEEV